MSTNHCSLSDYSHRSNQADRRLHAELTGNVDEAERAMRREVGVGCYLRAAHQPLGCYQVTRKTPSQFEGSHGASRRAGAAAAQSCWKGALHPAGDDGEATGAMHGEEAEGSAEIHPGVGHFG